MHDDAPRDPLDGLIDDVARSMTVAGPGTGLRPAIRARIGDAHPPSHRVSWRLAIAAASLAMMAIVALARFLPDDRHQPGAAAMRQGDVELPTLHSATTTIATGLGGPVPSRAAAEPSSRLSRSHGGMAVMPGPGQAAPADEPTESPIPSLVVQDVAIEPLLPSPVAIDDVIGPVPLQVQRLDIAALTLE